jgi:hypothetical protein
MHKILLTLISIVALGALVACGGGSSNNIAIPPAPSGGNGAGFGNSNMSGTYVYTVNGVASNGQFAVVGSFTTDGNGKITSGTRDTVNDAGGQTLNEAITGTYSVSGDGRGQLVLNGSNSASQAIYRFVLSSPSAGSLFQNGTGSSSVVADAVGRLELQTGSASASGTYIFRFDGEDTNKDPYGAIGGLSVSGGTISGSLDENDSGVYNGTLAATGGIALTGTRSTATITLPGDPNSSDTGTHHFLAYYVSANRLELLSTDTNFFLHGYADLQTANVAAATGNQVFNLSGFDGDSTSVFPVIETGRFTLTSGAAPVNAYVDYNEENTFWSPTFSGGPYTVSSGGRWAISLSGFSTGPFANQNLVGWQVTPTQSLVLVTYGNNTTIGSTYGIVATGDMRAQTLGLPNTSVNGNYAQFFSGTDTSLGNFESTGNYLASAGSLSGTIDSQTDSQGITVDSAQSGNYTVDPTYGRGTGSVSGVPVVFYTVDANVNDVYNDIYIISSNASSAYQGTLTLQVP